jgi:hypothetical protein
MQISAAWLAGVRKSGLKADQFRRNPTVSDGILQSRQRAGQVTACLLR